MRGRAPVSGLRGASTGRCAARRNIPGATAPGCGWRHAEMLQCRCETLSGAGAGRRGAPVRAARAAHARAGPEPGQPAPPAPRSDTIGRMRVTFLGQAGLYLETRAGSILCDPWFNPAYFGSWFPFPANDGIDPRDDRLARLPLREPPPPRPLRSALADRALQQGRAPSSCPTTPSTTSATSSTSSAFGASSRPPTASRSTSAAGCGSWSWPSTRRPTARWATRRCSSTTARPALLNMNDARPDRPRQAPRVRPARPALPAVLGRHLVPDGLRVPVRRPR